MRWFLYGLGGVVAFGALAEYPSVALALLGWVGALGVWMGCIWLACEVRPAWFGGSLAGLVLVGMYAWAHAHGGGDMAEALASYGWGNAPEWLRWVCAAQARTDCWS